MGDMLSQEEIDALLNGVDSKADDEPNTQDVDLAGDSGEFDVDNLASQEEYDPDLENAMSEMEMDALGEVGNISMGTAATTFSTLLNNKVVITTPKVTITTMKKLSKEYTIPSIAVKVEYKEGLLGSNLLVLKEDDVKKIADIMMGGDGNNISGDLNDLHLSAIAEAMNQMVGSSATSLSSMFSKKIDIMPPSAFVLDFAAVNDQLAELTTESEYIAKISFKMEVGDIINSEIMQLLPIRFAKALVDQMLNPLSQKAESESKSKNAGNDGQQVSQQQNAQVQPPVQQPMQQPVQQPQQYNQVPNQYQQQPMYDSQANQYQQQPMYDSQANQYQQQPMYQQPMYQQPVYQQPMYQPAPQQQVDVRPVQFQNFDNNTGRMHGNESIELIKDVPLEITVELGRTKKTIKEILEFNAGTVIELEKLSGEAVDILVNGKYIAKGEVVVIDENYGIRITDIVKQASRL